MRTLIPALALLAFSACAPDPLLGTFNFTMTGTDTQTAPGSGTQSVSGTGTFAVTIGKTDDYIVTLSHEQTAPCVLAADRNDKGDQVTFVAAQTCTFGGTSATLTSGSITGSEKGETASIAVNYNWQGSLLGINITGTGVRTYAGTRR